MITWNEIHDISLQDAADLTSNYRSQFEEGSTYIKGEYFGKSSIQATLEQEDSVGIRIYYGLDGVKKLGVHKSIDITNYAIREGIFIP